MKPAALALLLVAHTAAAQRVPLAVALSADGRLVAIGDGARVRVLDTASGAEVAALSGHKDEVEALAFAPDGQLASGARDGEIATWDVAARRRLHSMQTGGWIGALAWSPDGKRLASASADKQVRVWDGERAVVELVGLGEAAMAVAWSPDGTLIAAGDDDTIKLWEVATAREAATLEHLGDVRALSFSPDGKLLAGGGRAAVVRLWDVAAALAVPLPEPPKPKRKKKNAPPPEPLPPVRQPALREVPAHEVVLAIEWQGEVPVAHDSPDARAMAVAAGQLAVVSGGGALEVAGRRLQPARPGPLRALLAMNGALVAAGDQATVFTWPADGGAPLIRRVAQPIYGLAPFSGNVATQAGARALALSASGKKLAWGGDDGRIHIGGQHWDAHAGGVLALVALADGWASAGADRTVRLWDGGGKARAVLAGHSDTVRALALDGPNLVSGGADGTVRVWDLASGAETAHYDQGADVLALAAAGGQVAAGGRDGRIRIWPMGLLVPAHAGPVRALAALDGGFASTGDDGIIRLWTWMGVPRGLRVGSVEGDFATVSTTQVKTSPAGAKLEPRP